MDLKGIVGLKGKSGLFKIVSAPEARVIIVESFEDGKRFPFNDPYGVLSLETTTVFTHDDSMKLEDIFLNIKNNESQNPVPDIKSDPKVLKKYFRTVAPDFDEEKVYGSDIKKIISWYIILKGRNFFAESDSKSETDSELDPNN